MSVTRAKSMGRASYSGRLERFTAMPVFDHFQTSVLLFTPLHKTRVNNVNNGTPMSSVVNNRSLENLSKQVNFFPETKTQTLRLGRQWTVCLRRWFCILFPLKPMSGCRTNSGVLCFLRQHKTSLTKRDDYQYPTVYRRPVNNQKTQYSLYSVHKTTGHRSNALSQCKTFRGKDKWNYGTQQEYLGWHLLFCLSPDCKVCLWVSKNDNSRLWCLPFSELQHVSFLFSTHPDAFICMLKSMPNGLSGIYRGALVDVFQPRLYLVEKKDT